MEKTIWDSWVPMQFYHGLRGDVKRNIVMTAKCNVLLT